MRFCLFALIGLALMSCQGTAPQGPPEPPAKLQFGQQTSAAPQAPEVFGGYSKGCVGGAKQLAESGPSWQAMRLSRGRNWGHPDLLRFVTRLGAHAQSIGWPGIYVGDMAQPRGGPMLTGHASHQTGLDVDIWMRPPKRLDLSRTERENLSSISIRTRDQRNVNSNWTPEHHALLRAAAEDPAVARIFVTGAAKLRMCADTAPGDRAWLRKIRPWWGHHYHFHVRLNCPAGSRECVNQDPPPPGDGCADAVWWVTDALKPKKPVKPDPTKPKPKPRRGPLTLSDLPPACRGVLLR